jgi:hypothetical protein
MEYALPTGPFRSAVLDRPQHFRARQLLQAELCQIAELICVHPAHAQAYLVPLDNTISTSVACDLDGGNEADP